MPRWASRIALEIVSVKVERVQDISIHDVQAEGVRSSAYPGSRSALRRFHAQLRGAFRETWDSFYARHGFGWDENPWVWALEFKHA